MTLKKMISEKDPDLFITQEEVERRLEGFIEKYGDLSSEILSGGVPEGMSLFEAKVWKMYLRMDGKHSRLSKLGERISR